MYTLCTVDFLKLWTQGGPMISQVNPLTYHQIVNKDYLHFLITLQCIIVRFGATTRNLRNKETFLVF